MGNQLSTLDYALAYEKLGFFVLPIHPIEKKPLVKWAYRANRRPDEKEIRGWWHQFSDARVGLATGKHSGFIVLDFDKPNAQERLEAILNEQLPDTIRVESGRGHHLWLTHPGIYVPTVNGLIPGVDLKADDNQFVLAPPSLHPKSGKRYEFSDVNPILDDLEDLLDCPQSLLDLIWAEKARTKAPSIAITRDNPVNLDFNNIGPLTDLDREKIKLLSDLNPNFALILDGRWKEVKADATV